MNVQDFVVPEMGELVPVTGLSGAQYAFVPAPLPPKWEWPSDLWPLLLEARVALATLSGIGAHLPDPQVILRPLNFREAVRSSSLEGTYTHPQQQALFEMDPEALSEAERRNTAYREISNYSRALDIYFTSLHSLPLSLRLIRELHAILMDGVRGADKEPGQFRRLQVQIGWPPRFVPPPANQIPECLDLLEKYIHNESPTGKSTYDPLVDAFLVHYQFETIHPFRDGNGRVGRLLLSIMITERCQLSASWLHMSAYFDDHRNDYIDRLYRVSTQGDIRGWIEFCLRGVIVQAQDTLERCTRLLNLQHEYREKINLLKGNYRLQTIVHDLFSVPVVQIPYLARKFQVSYPTAKSDVDRLVASGILAEAPNTGLKTYISPEIIETIYG